jgi:phage FluMu gp28-like protein
VLLNHEKQQTRNGEEDPVPEKASDFAQSWLGFKPAPYQAELLDDPSKRIVVVFPRQSGKTTTLSIRMIHFALRNRHTLSLIVSPGLRQSMIVMDHIQDQLTRMSQERQREQIKLMQRTVITCRNGSRIVALPCAVNMLRGYAASEVLVDEAAFIRDDQTIFYNVLFPMLQATRGALIVSSTPWGKDSVFYQFTQDSAFKKHRTTIDKVIEAGLATKEFVKEMERRTPRERFRREYLAEFVEDELAYFTQDLITQCIDSELSPITEDWTKDIQSEVGRYFVGVDLGKHVDYSAIAIVRRDGETVKLVGSVRFPLETPYASVIGYVKVVCDKLRSAEKTFCDQTGVGDFIVEAAKEAGIRSSIEGIMLSLPTKQEILGYMKQLMQTRQLHLYYDADLIAEINVERFELSKIGQMMFSHPEGTHDDRLWAVALAVYATKSLPAGSFVPIKRR